MPSGRSTEPCPPRRLDRNRTTARTDIGTIPFDLAGDSRAESGMQLAESKLDGITVISVTGPVNGATADDLEDRCRVLQVEGFQSLILDLAAVTLLGSAGLRSFLAVGKSLREAHGTLVLVAPTGPVRDLLESSGIPRALPVCTSLEEARRQLDGEFTIQESREWGDAVIRIFGRLDAFHSAKLERAGRHILEAGHVKLVIDLGGVTYVSSGGLFALINLGKLAAARNSRIILCRPAPSVMHLLTLSGVDNLFPISPSVDEALTR